MNYRENWKKLSDEHYNNTVKSHEAGIYSSVVMHSGYTIECGLKAAICARIDEFLSPEQGDYKTHNFDSLLNKANLKKEFRKEQKRSPKFKAHWSTVSKWNPELRYKQPSSKSVKDDSTKQVNAITDEKDGVRRWIEIYW